MVEIKKAKTDHPVHDLISDRWSPYAFDDRAVDSEDLQSLFEAARWAPSSYNEQPWRYILATRDNPEAFDLLLSCLVEGNQKWARNASALALGVVKLRFDRNDRTNKAAHHDLGLAAANLTLEATSRGLFVHQMIGILPDRARELYQIPEGYEVLTALAIGYPGSDDGDLGKRDRSPRNRRPIQDLVFSGEFGKPFESWK